MAKISGTNVLLYSNGKAIAIQQGLSLNWNHSLIDGSNKESLSWWEGGPGLKDAEIEFKALYATGLMTDTPAILGAKDLLDKIINSSRLLVSILGLDWPIVGEADMSSLKFDAPVEGAMGLTGSLKVSGPLWMLSGVYANLITDPDVGGTDYDHHTDVGLAFTELINDAGTAYAKSNTFAVATGDVIKLFVFITLNGGQLPDVAIFEVGGGAAAISNVETLVEGLNVVTLTVTDTHDGCLNISNTGASDLVTSPIYLFKTA